MQTEELTLKQIKTELLKLETTYEKLYKQYTKMQGDIDREDLSSSLQNDIYNNGLSEKIAALASRISVLEGYVTTLNDNVTAFNNHKHNTSTSKADTAMETLS